MANAVHPTDIGLVLNGPGTQQQVPRRTTRDGPRSHVERYVVGFGTIGCIAGKDGEAQVVAYLQQEAHPSPLHNHSLFAGRIVQLFATVGEEVVLVVVGHFARGLDKVEAVVVATLRFGGYATGQGGIEPTGHLLHPLE